MVVVNRFTDNFRIHNSVWWTNGRVTLVEKGRMHMENTSKSATLFVDNCQIKDSGIYELTIQNESGDVTVEVPVKIVGKAWLWCGVLPFSRPCIATSLKPTNAMFAFCAANA